MRHPSLPVLLLVLTGALLHPTQGQRLIGDRPSPPCVDVSAGAMGTDQSATVCPPT